MVGWMYLSIILCNRKERCSYKQVFEKEINLTIKTQQHFPQLGAFHNRQWHIAVSNHQHKGYKI